MQKLRPREGLQAMLTLFGRERRKHKYVFIFTYGRSGSTLLMGLLNSLPHYCIRGENNNVLYRIYEAVAALEKARAGALRNSDRSTHPWFGLARSDPERFAQQLIEAFVDRVLVPERGHEVLGFKEIRFSQSEMPDFDGYLAFLRKRFPGCRIIFNHRRLADVAASKWWATMPQAPEKLQFMEDRFLSVPDAPDVFRFQYERIDDGLAHVRQLFGFLGEPLDEAAVRAVLSVRHSY